MSPNWSYGVTTVPARMDDLLPRTLASLTRAGFDRPRLFVDGCEEFGGGHYRAYRDRFPALPVVPRFEYARTTAHWVLSLYELYAREPAADRFAVFQDDFVTYRNLRDYLDACQYPEKGYWNLYTFPSNEGVCPKAPDGKEYVGFYKSRFLDSGPPGFQTGRGAVALVFSREAVMTLLSSRHLVEKFQDAHRGHEKVDGGIVTAMNQAGWSEYVHNPSLVQHTGDVSVMGHLPHKRSNTFRGEDYDALDLL